MALNALTLTVSNGVQGRHFKGAVSGMTAGNLVEVMPGSAPGFGYSNGFLTNPSLSYDVNLAILRERNETTGENRTTQLLITATGLYAVQQQAAGISAGGAYRAAAVPSGDGSHVWNVFVQGPTGATTSAVIGSTAPTLATLTLSGSLQIGTATSGTIIGATAGSTIVGNIPGITVNSAARTYSGTPTGSAATISNGLVETLTGATNTPNSSSITVAAAAVTLGTLTLSGSLQIGTATSGTIIGATAGSTIAGNIPGITVNSGARTYSGTPTGSAATISNGLVETLTGATNTPNNSSITVAAAAVTLADLTLSPLTATAGTAYSGTISGNAAGSSIGAVSSDGTTLTVTGTTVSGTFAAAGSPTVTLTETLAGATNTPHASPAQTVVVAASGGPPTGFTYFMDPDGSRLTDADGAYLMEPA